MTTWLEHTALQVRNLDWYIHFFKDVFEMDIRMTMGEAPHRKVWLYGGIQLNENPDFTPQAGFLDHLGLMTDDLDKALAKVYTYDVQEQPQGRNWVALPDGIILEIIAGKADVIHEAVSLKPWL